MTNRKICPLMSGPVESINMAIAAAPACNTPNHEIIGVNIETRYVECIQEKCMFWESTMAVDEFDTVASGDCILKYKQISAYSSRFH